MARGLDATLTTAVGDTATKPYFLVYMGFSTPVRMSTRASITWGGFTYLAAGITVSGQADSPTIQVFNETTLFGQVVLVDGTSGRDVKIYQGYMNDSAHPSPELVFDGEMGEASIGDMVSIKCKRNAPLRTPRHYSVPPVVNHVPPSGTRFETPKQVVILERD